MRNRSFPTFFAIVGVMFLFLGNSSIAQKPQVEKETLVRDYDYPSSRPATEPVRAAKKGKVEPEHRLQKRRKQTRLRGEQEFNKRREELGRADQELRRREAELQERDRNLDRRNEDLERRQAEMKEQQQDLDRRSEELDRRNEDLERRQAEMKEQQQDLDRRSEELDRRNEELDKKAGEVERETNFKRREFELQMREEKLNRRVRETKNRHPDAGPIVAIVLILGIILWIWALGDCLSRPDDTFPSRGPNDKLAWTLVILFTFVIGAALYLFRVRRRSAETPAEV